MLGKNSNITFFVHVWLWKWKFQEEGGLKGQNVYTGSQLVIIGKLWDQYHSCQLSRIQHRSPALLYWSPYLPDKLIFWAFLCLSLKFSPFSAQNLNFLIHSAVSGAFLHIFSHWQRLFLASKWWLRILIVCSSCKTSYNVISHAHWGLSIGGYPLGVVKKRETPDFRSPEVGISAVLCVLREEMFVLLKVK